MKRKTKILTGVIVGLVCLIGIVCAGIYISYKKSLEVERPGEDYEQIYTDEQNVKEAIEPVSKGGIAVAFSQLSNEKSLLNQFPFLKTCQQDVTASSVKIKEMEEFAGLSLEKHFQGYTRAFPKKHKIEQTGTGYDFQLQNKEGLGEEVYVLVMDRELFDRLPEGEQTTIGEVPAKVYYTHNKRTNIEEKRTVDQYMYEAVFVKEGVTFYVQINFSGFDYAVNMVDTTKEATSEKVADILTTIVKERG